jgi:hypothetical protein
MHIFDPACHESVRDQRSCFLVEVADNDVRGLIFEDVRHQKIDIHEGRGRFRPPSRGQAVYRHKNVEADPRIRGRGVWTLAKTRLGYLCLSYDSELFLKRFTTRLNSTKIVSEHFVCGNEGSLPKPCIYNFLHQCFETRLTGFLAAFSALAGSCVTVV